MIKSLKEFNTGKKYYWVAKTSSGKYIENMFSKIATNSFRKDKDSKKTVVEILSVPATSEKDINAKEKLLDLLKSKMKFSDEQIAKLNIECINGKDLPKPKVLENKKLRESKKELLNKDIYTLTLLYNIYDYLKYFDNIRVEYYDTTLKIIDIPFEMQICDILWGNKKYFIFNKDSEYYYSGSSLYEFMDDFDEAYESFLNFNF